nr:hypothetical protein RAR13_28760 [Aminobacter niigataensis]
MPTSIYFHGHSVTVANEMALISVGENPATDPKGHLSVSPDEHYVRGITKLARAVLKLHEQISDRAAFLVHPPSPDIVLVPQHPPDKNSPCARF